MKQLTKEQHEAICEWLNKNNITITEVDQQGTSDTYFASHKFRQDFEKSCCDSCADGETCESEPVIGEGTACFESLERAKYKHVVNFDMSNITDLTWEQSTKLSELLSLGSTILVNHKGEQYLINTQDVKPVDIIAK
jgi:hypothetical protein